MAVAGLSDRRLCLFAGAGMGDCRGRADQRRGAAPLGAGRAASWQRAGRWHPAGAGPHGRYPPDADRSGTGLRHRSRTRDRDAGTGRRLRPRASGDDRHRLARGPALCSGSGTGDPPPSRDNGGGSDALAAWPCRAACVGRRALRAPWARSGAAAVA
ncbi:UNVERIFIED_CONTAM: hypothetical protein NCL1_02770 [Trichonephila clavipes]